MATNNAHVSDLQQWLQRGKVVTIIGSGVSRATSSLAPGWPALIESGLDYCGQLGMPDEEQNLVRGILALNSLDMLLAAAEIVDKKLRGLGELGPWLGTVFKDLPPERPELIQQIVALDTPLLTTNYDGLIEQVTGLREVTWMDSRRVEGVVRGGDRRVLHLHGHWDEPDSVVLGIRSYEAVKNHPHTQAVMQALAMTNILLFIGCGQDGLADPNFGNFLTWLKAIESAGKTQDRHYRLVCSAEWFEPQGRLFPLEYGSSHADLIPFLKTLQPKTAAGSVRAAQPLRVLSPVPASVDHYLQRLAAEHSHLTLMGMGRSLQVELPIDEAYVPLQTNLARSLEQHPSPRFADGCAEYEEQVDLSAVFRWADRFGQRGVVLLGEPGSGKTTGARQLTWRLASRQSLPEDLGLPTGLTPVFLRFRNLSRQALEANSLRQFLEQETHCEMAPDGCQAPAEDLWNGRAGGLLWILDGLDEIIEPAARRAVAEWIRQALRGRLQDHFLVTCRFQGYYEQGVPLGPKFVTFHVRPLDDPQIKRFVRDWFAAAYGRILTHGPQARARSSADSDQLLAILEHAADQAGHLRELCTNPLLLTILCIVFHEERKLPTGRAELYAHCVRVLLEYWRRDLYESELGTRLQPYDAEAAQAVLARVAWWMHQQQKRTSADLDELAGEAGEALARVAPSSGLGRDGLAFLQRMRDETGILAMTAEGQGRCGFLHLTFQEYLAAEHAARENLANELADRAADSWWREVALLSLRRSRPYCEEFFRAMLQAGLAELHPDLAERCLQEALYFAPEPFLELLQNPAPPERVAAVLRLLRDRADQVPGLDVISRRLAASADAATRSFAREILIRCGAESPAAAEEQGLLVDERTGITFVRIPAGEFLMGSDRGTTWEAPVHRVRISKPFWLAKYPLTNEQYARFLKAGGGRARKPEQWDDRRFNRPEQPVVGVSWEDARAFCEWAQCRLPTEAEWEYACRAGTTTEYCFGDDPALLAHYGWFNDNSGGQTQPVGAKKPNAWGLHDMHGNVWEWCQDWFAEDYYAQSPEVDPMGPQEAGRRVNRGGSWADEARNCRSAYRCGYVPTIRIEFLGFRPARGPSGL